jgi:hypothetical protein
MIDAYLNKGSGLLEHMVRLPDLLSLHAEFKLLNLKSATAAYKSALSIAARTSSSPE